jgi:quinoprotein glucose dehydrogenase
MCICRSKRRPTISYGGNRLGNNLYSSTLVCVDIRTGKPVWHFQHVHHDIWDRDTPNAPILVDLRVNNTPIKGRLFF